MSATRKTINYVDRAGVYQEGIVVVNQQGVNRWLTKIGVTSFLNSKNEQIDDYDLLETTNEFRLGPNLQPPPAPEQKALMDLVHLPKLTLESIEQQGNVDEYIMAASACKGQSEMKTIWEKVMTLQNSREFDEFPSPFICVLASSGMGKTQLAATTAILRGESDVFYFYTGATNIDYPQPFYLPHVGIWPHLKRQLENLRITMPGDTDLPGATRILNETSPHVVFQFLNLLFCGTNESISSSNLRNKLKEMRGKMFVFVDEVPPKDQYLAAMMLRDCLRALGIVPILMSTHSGAHNATTQGAGSRTGEGPELWCSLITDLPKYAGKKASYGLPSERPLVHTILAGMPEDDQKHLHLCVQAVRDKLQATKRDAWRDSPLFQLCQLFRSSKDKKSPMSSSHCLVGKHFGSFELPQWDVNRDQVQWLEQEGRVRMPVADDEPILFLALTTWWEDEIWQNQRSKFPLVDKLGKPMSVRSVYEANKSAFRSDVASENPVALKLNGDLLEVLSLASVTLASLRSDDGFLSGVPLARFIATVFCLMDQKPLTKQTLQAQEAQVQAILQGLKKFQDIKVPACPSADSDFPQEFYGQNQRGHLKRPPDGEKRDGCLQRSGLDLVRIECKNYKDGLSTEVLEKIIKRFRNSVHVSFIFTSKVNGVWSKKENMDQFWEKLGIVEPKKEFGFLHISSEGKCCWIKTADGNTEFKPDNTTPHLAVLFANGKVE